MSSRLAQMPWPVTTLHRLDCVTESQAGGIVAKHVSQAVDRALRLCMVLPAHTADHVACKICISQTFAADHV